MAYEINWYEPDHILNVTFGETLTRNNLEKLNEEIVIYLEKHNHNLELVINATKFNAGYFTIDDLRMTQNYRNHDNLKSAFVIAEDKVTRLSMLVAFNLSRTRFKHFNNLPSLVAFLNGRSTQGQVELGY